VSTPLGVCTTDTTSPASACDCFVGVNARPGDRDVPAREINTTTCSIAASAAFTSQATLPTRFGFVCAGAASTTRTTLRDVVGKRAPVPHDDSSTRGVEPTSESIHPIAARAAVTACCRFACCASSTRNLVPLDASVIENDFATVIENPTPQRVSASGRSAAAIVHGVTASNGHVLELDNHVRSNDVEHAIRHSLLNRRSASFPHKEEGLGPGSVAVDVEIATSAGQRIRCSGGQVDGFRCIGCVIVVGYYQVCSQTVGATIEHQGVWIEDGRNDPIAQLLHFELCRGLLLADRAENALENFIPAQLFARHGELPHAEWLGARKFRISRAFSDERFRRAVPRQTSDLFQLRQPERKQNRDLRPLPARRSGMKLNARRDV
jgi:hypothetical protein